MSEAQAILSAPSWRTRLPPPPCSPPGARGSRAELSSLLMLDPDLAGDSVPEARVSLRERMLVQVEPFTTGSWSPPPGPVSVSALLVVASLSGVAGG